MSTDASTNELMEMGVALLAHGDHLRIQEKAATDTTVAAALRAYAAAHDAECLIVLRELCAAWIKQRAKA